MSWYQRIVAVTQGSHGAVVINNNNTPTNSADDFVVYTPAAGYLGADTFTYTANSLTGTPETRQVSVTVLAPAVLSTMIAESFSVIV